MLDLIGEDILYITSANANKDHTHYAIGEIRREFGHRDDVVFIGHRNERANRRRYPHHRPCSTSIVGFDTGELVLERHGSLDAAMIARVADKHGLALQVAADERLPVRRTALAARRQLGFGLGRRDRRGRRDVASAPPLRAL